MCQTYQKAVKGSAGRSQPEQAPAPHEQGKWDARVGGHAFPLGPYSLAETVQLNQDAE